MKGLNALQRAWDTFANKKLEVYAALDKQNRLLDGDYEFNTKLEDVSRDRDAAYKPEKLPECWRPSGRSPKMPGVTYIIQPDGTVRNATESEIQQLGGHE
jgi:hypothetical protein